MPFITKVFYSFIVSFFIYNTIAFSQTVNCKPLPSVALDYDVLKLSFTNEGFDNYIIDDTVYLQSDIAFVIKTEFKSYSKYKICFVADAAVSATGFELDDNSGAPLDFTSNYTEIDKNELIYDFGPEPGGDYYLKFKAIKKNGQPTCAFILVMEKKVENAIKK